MREEPGKLAEEKKMLEPAEVLAALARGEQGDVYDTLKNLGDDRAAYDAFAEENGFADLDEMVAFYTIGEAGDDAPGAKRRNGVREMFEICLEDYSGASEETQAVRKADERVLVLAALRSSVLPLLFVVAFIVMWAWRGNPIALAGLAVACCWSVFQIAVSYRQARFLRRAYDLFRRYGVRRVDAEVEKAWESVEEEELGIRPTETSEKACAPSEVHGEENVEEALSEEVVAAESIVVEEPGVASDNTGAAASVAAVVRAAPPVAQSVVSASDQVRRLDYSRRKNRPVKLPGAKNSKPAPRRF